LKRGLSQNAVVAPYATALAAMVDPGAAARNFARLAALGARGRYGFYEALDYTSTRLPEGKDVAIIRAFLAHHQGMTVVAIANGLLDGRCGNGFMPSQSCRRRNFCCRNARRAMSRSSSQGGEVEAAATVATWSSCGGGGSARATAPRAGASAFERPGIQ